MVSISAGNFSDYTKSFFLDDHYLSQAKREKLQLEAIQERFAAVQSKIPPLAALADAQNIRSIKTLDDVPSLMFPHSFYKSYPEQIIGDHNFPALTSWLSRLTIRDLSEVAGREYETIDSWLEALDKQTELNVQHSSGTTGRMSFVPKDKVWSVRNRHMFKSVIEREMAPLKFDQFHPDFLVLWPTYRGGRSPVLQAAQIYADVFCSKPDDFYPLIPFDLSADYQNYLQEANQAKAGGRFLSPQPSDYVAEKIRQSVEQNQNYEQRLNNLLDLIEAEPKGRKFIMAGGPILLHQISKAGLERGMESVFASGSIVVSFGGFKGLPQQGNEVETISRFSGLANFSNAYGMTEWYEGCWMCSAGRFHIPPLLVAYILDPITGKPKPRQGVQEGHGAFFDIVGEAHWCGLISADHLEISWNPCSCGRTSPHIKDDIKRVSDSPESEYYIGPAPDEAIDMALEALTEGLD